MYSDQAVAKIRREVEAHGEADMWTSTYREIEPRKSTGTVESLAKGK